MGRGVLAAAEAGMSPQGVRERVVEPYRTHMAATIAHESRP